MTTKVHLACDGRGFPLALLITPGQRHDSICAQALLDRIRRPPSSLGGTLPAQQRPAHPAHRPG
ncbi:transposase [Streptomyces achromogenes]|uniref:transposase n=1 Tax=Streptomyces achromogenes TaxID=67255 RepID=UPI003F4CE8CD